MELSKCCPTLIRDFCGYPVGFLKEIPSRNKAMNYKFGNFNILAKNGLHIMLNPKSAIT